MADPSEQDWTNGPAKWFAVAVLALLGGLGLGWSIGRGNQPVPLASARPSTTDVGTRVEPPAPVAQTESPPAAARISKAEATKAPKPPARLEMRINLNTATEAELDLLPGIGPSLAQRIIEYRQSRGRFATIDELDAVRGIGPTLMARLRDLVTVEDATGTPTDASDGARQPGP